MAEHPTTEGLPITDRDPQRYVEDVEASTPSRPEEQSEPKDFSLRIGSLKGQ